MVYNVNDNRIVMGGYFMEQDETGNIHIYKKGSMEYIECIDNIGGMPFDEFKCCCNQWLVEKR